MRQRVAELEEGATALQNAAEQAHSLKLVIGKLETFAALVCDQLDEADWTTRRDLIRTLVRRIEVDDQHVRVVFRVGPEPQDGAGSRRTSHLCPGRDLGMWWRRSAFALNGTGYPGSEGGLLSYAGMLTPPIAGSVQQRHGRGWLERRADPDPDEVV